MATRRTSSECEVTLWRSVLVAANQFLREPPPVPYVPAHRRGRPSPPPGSEDRARGGGSPGTWRGAPPNPRSFPRFFFFFMPPLKKKLFFPSHPFQRTFFA